MMEEQSWYYFAGGRNEGPISGGELRMLFFSEKLPLSTLVWTESMPAWRPASEIDAFCSAVMSFVEEPATDGGADQSAANNPFQYLRVRSLLGWTMLGFALAYLFSYVISFGRESEEYSLIAYILFNSIYIWILLCVVLKFKKHRILWKSFIGELPRKRYWLKWSLTVVGMVLFSIGCSSLLWYLLSFVNPAYVEYNFNTDSIFESFVVSKPVPYIVIGIIVTVLVAPVVEEVVFRGIIFQRWATKWGIFPGMVLSSLLFGLCHDDIFGSTFLGLVMCFLYLETRTLWIPVLCHAFNNISCVAFMGGDYLLNGASEFCIYEFRSEIWIGVLCFLIAFPWVVIYVRRIRIRSRNASLVVGSDASPKEFKGRRRRRSRRSLIWASVLLGILALASIFVPIAIYNYRRDKYFQKEWNSMRPMYEYRVD